MNVPQHIVVIGLGYVGLPLALALARKFRVTGLDVDKRRIAELLTGYDRTNEISRSQLHESEIILTDDPMLCRGADVYIVTVPTPVTADCKPDLGPVRNATKTVAKLIDPAVTATIIYESTVYPGVTEDICGKLLASESGLQRGRHFFLGYSPERINPGDREHAIDMITKVVAGENDDVTELLATIYGAITSGGVFRAASIKVAEAAKVIENAQRDINIAFMNEIAQIFSKLDLSVWDVLDAAQTKWNFLPFRPGLVGGHCIGVDPYYLSFRAQELGVEPNVILSGRSTNDGMGAWVADRINERLAPRSEVLIMGLTFKENVPDLRNSKVIDIIRRLREHGHDLVVHDPHALRTDAQDEYGIALDPDAMGRTYDAVFVAVPHAVYAEMDDAAIARMVRPGGTLFDLKNVFGKRSLPGVARWTL